MELWLRYCFVLLVLIYIVRPGFYSPSSSPLPSSRTDIIEILTYSYQNIAKDLLSEFLSVNDAQLDELVKVNGWVRKGDNMVSLETNLDVAMKPRSIMEKIDYECMLVLRFSFGMQVRDGLSFCHVPFSYFNSWFIFSAPFGFCICLTAYASRGCQRWGFSLLSPPLPLPWPLILLLQVVSSYTSVAFFMVRMLATFSNYHNIPQLHRHGQGRCPCRLRRGPPGDF